MQFFMYLILYDEIIRNLFENWFLFVQIIVHLTCALLFGILFNPQQIINAFNKDFCMFYIIS